MFLIKKYLTPLFYSFSLTVILLIAGLCLLVFTCRQKAGKIVTAAGVILVLLMSLSPLPDLMLRPLEDRYPPFRIENVESPVKWVVILGGGVRTEAGLALADRIAPNAMVRLVEGINIHYKIPGSRLVLAGGALYGSEAEAEVMAKIAATLNVRPENLVLESKSKDTEEQARLIASIVDKDRFVLVTSAFHMSRSMTIFNKYGAKPIAAPVNRITGNKSELYPAMFYPSASGFYKADIAIHEYLGLAWLWLKKMNS